MKIENVFLIATFKIFVVSFYIYKENMYIKS